MRVTSGMSLRNTMRDLSQSLERLQDSQRRLSSGRAHERMSDDPRTATDVLFLRGAIERHDQRVRTTANTRDRLALADTALVGASDVMIRVKELTVRASNSGVSDPASRTALAAEMRSLRSELLATANTEYVGRPLFAGTSVGPSYDTGTGAYLGDDVVETRTVAEGVDVAANVTGEQVFGDQSAPEGDLFAVLDRLATAIESGDNTAIATEHANVDVARIRLGSAVAEVGRRVAQLDDVTASSAIRREQLVARLSEIEDVDLAETVVDVTSHEAAYQAALAAAARAMPPSLAQYLR